MLLVSLLTEVQSLTDNLPDGCQVAFPDANKLHELVISIAPPSGYWSRGTFVFDISVPLEYNIMVSQAENSSMETYCISFGFCELK